MATKGLERNSQRRVRFIEEAETAVFNPAGEINDAFFMRLEEQPESGWAKFRAMGFNAKTWSAITRKHRVLSGPLRLDFRGMPFLARLLTGAAVETNAISANVEELIYLMPESDAVNRQTQSVEIGLPSKCSRSTYTLLSDMTLNFVRMEENSEGQAGFISRRAHPLAGGAIDAVMTNANNVNEVQTLSIPTATGNVPVTLPNTTLGAGGVVQISDAMTGVQVAAAMAAKASIRDAANVAIVKAVAGGNSVFTITYAGALSARPLALPTTVAAGVNVARTTAGVTGTVPPLPKRFPILPQNVTVRRASTLAGLDAAAPIKRVAALSVTFPQMVDIEMFFDDENVIDFTDHVDTEYEITMSLRVASGTQDCLDLEAKSETQPATADWFRIRCAHVDGIHAVEIDGMWSVEGNIPFSVNKNVRYREFPMGIEVNDQGWLFRVRVRRAINL